MKSLIHVITLLLLGNSICLAQETQTPENKKEKLAGFEWLKQFEGDWVTDNMGMKSRVVGERWIVNELKGQTGQAGVNYSAIQSIGYDEEKKQFTGTWIDSTSSFLWHYTGSLDDTGKKLILDAKGPDFSNSKKMRSYQDIYEFKSENEVAASSKMLNDEGEWVIFQTGTMKKTATESKPKLQATVKPFLMFTGKAEEAINFYKTVFPDTYVDSMTKYKAGEAGKEGTIQVATFVIEGQRVMCTDSPPVHDFDFTPSFSFFVECENEEQLKERFAKLSEGGKVMMPLNNYGFSKQFGWTSDKFGVSWQLNLQ